MNFWTILATLINALVRVPGHLVYILRQHSRLLSEFFRKELTALNETRFSTMVLAKRG